MSDPDGFPELASASDKKVAPIENDLSARSRFLVAITGIIILSWLMYYWNGELAQGVQVQDVDIKMKVELKAEKLSRDSEHIMTLSPLDVVTHPPIDNDGAETDGATDPPVEGDGDENDDVTEPPEKSVDDENDNVTEPPEESDDDENDNVTEPPIDDIPIESDGSCDALCDKREENRKTKFGGDLLDVNEVLRLAKEGRDKTIKALREAYGDYFDAMFVDGTDMDGEPSYKGMSDVGFRSKDRLKRKLKLKVLKMIKNIRVSESDIMGCDCVKKQGKANDTPDDRAYDIPDFYEQYVFANGGHSQAAGHGNLFKQSYAGYFETDLRPVWEAVGINMIARNYASGAMKASPYISACSKEIFGVDVDLLVWNYGMTDKGLASAAYYMYRGATSPGRPALLFVDGAKPAKYVGTQLDARGISVFQSNLNLEAVPDSAPDGIPLSSAELEKLPEMLQHLKGKNRLEGEEGGSQFKWSCTGAMQAAGSDCVCPEVPARTSWHMGYRAHALQGHLISLPFIEILIEALSEITASTRDTMSLLEEIETEENREYEAFLAEPLPEIQGQEELFGKALNDETLMDTWFKGPSLCRTPLLPAESRFLGLTTNTTKIGKVSKCGAETYDTGVSINREGGIYSYLTEVTPTPGDFNIIAPNKFRSCYDEEKCPEIVMPDYKDWFWGVLKDGKVSATLPNEKEKEYYGYDPTKFKGIIGLIPTIFPETTRGLPIGDLNVSDFQDHLKLTVNGKPVAKYRIFNHMAILEGEDGSVFWEPSPNSDYVLEFEPSGELEDGRAAADLHLRLHGFVLY